MRTRVTVSPPKAGTLFAWTVACLSKFVFVRFETLASLFTTGNVYKGRNVLSRLFSLLFLLLLLLLLLLLRLLLLC